MIIQGKCGELRVLSTSASIFFRCNIPLKVCLVWIDWSLHFSNRSKQALFTASLAKWSKRQGRASY
jgi:hypothetical protein